MPFQSHLPKHMDPESNLSPVYTDDHPKHNVKSAPAVAPARNYVFVEKTGNEHITGTFHIDTDLPEPFGLFDAEHERDAAPNLYLHAQYMDIDIIVSGSKKATIVVSDGKWNSEFSRYIIRIHTNGDAEAMTPFKLDISQTASGRSLVAIMQPQAFMGFVEGSAQLSKGVLDVATNLMIPKDTRRDRTWLGCVEARTRWLVLPSTHELPDFPGEDFRARKTAFLAEASTLTWQIIGTDSRSPGAFEERRTVCYHHEYNDLREAMVMDEDRIKSKRHAFSVVWKVAFALLLTWGLWTSSTGSSPVSLLVVFGIFLLGLVAAIALLFDFVC